MFPTGRALTGINREDIKVNGSRMIVTVHSLGSVDAPVGLFPKTATVAITLPAAADWKDGSVDVEPGGRLAEITQMNNRVQLH